MRTAIVVHNENAGAREFARGDVVKLVERRGFAVKHYSSKKPGLEAKLARPCDLVVAAGGDGTIAKVAKFLAMQQEDPPPLAILPLGTSNNIALSLGIRGTPKELVAAWDDNNMRALSYGVAKAHWGEQLFIEGVGMGPLAQATTPKAKGKKTRDERIEDGRFAFRNAMREAKPERLYINVDGERIEEEILLVEVLNIRQVGPRLQLAPTADAADDLLDVVYVPTSKRKRMMAWVDALIEAGSDADKLPKPPVAWVRGKKVVIAWNGMELRIDDKFPLMPGQATPPAQAAEDERRTKDHADLLSLEIAARRLRILAPVKPKRSAAKR